MTEWDALTWCTGIIRESKDMKRRVGTVIRDLEKAVKLAKKLELHYRKDIAPGDKYDMYDELHDLIVDISEDTRKMEGKL